MIKKIGNVYCIKNYSELNIVIFIKDNIYNVIEANSFTFSIADGNNRKLTFNKNSPFNQYTIQNHFVSLKEYRKLKLEKLKK